MKRTLPYILPFLCYLASVFFEGVVKLVLAGVSFALLVALWPRFNLRLYWSSRAFWTGVLVFLIWVGLEDVYHFTPQPVDLLYVIPIFFLVAPFVEELFFRHFLFSYRRKKKSFPWLRVSVSAVLYGFFLYPRWITGLIAAVIYSWLYFKEREVEPLILAHITANLLIVFYALFTKGFFLFY